MNALAEPFELLESECEARSWYELPVAADDDPVIESPFGARVLAWTVERICSCPCFRRTPETAGA